MNCTKEYKEHIEYTFHAFCKIVIHHAAITAARTAGRKQKHEISLEYLAEEKHYPFATEDRSPVHGKRCALYRYQQWQAEAKRELAVKRRQLTQAERRIEELDRLFKRIYEDNANGKLSDSRFQMLSDDYEQEQEELREKLLLLNEEITQQEEQTGKIDRFIGKVQKYLDLDELTPAILNDMVKAVYVHAPDKSKGYREQQIDISYDLVGILPAALLNDLQNGETA